MTVKVFWIGFLAGSAAIASAYAARLSLGVLFLPELAAQALFSRVPGWVEAALVSSLGFLAKYIAISAAVLLNVLIYGLLTNALYGLANRHNLRGGGLAVLLFAAPYSAFLTLASIFLTMTEVSALRVTYLDVAFHLLLPNSVYALLAYGMSIREPSLASRALCIKRSNALVEGRVALYKRRLIIKAASASAVAATLLLYGLGYLFADRGYVGRAEGEGRKGGDLKSFLAGEITPNDLFYRVDLNFYPPSVNLSDWKLKVRGLVERPLELSYESLLSMEAVEEYVTLECVSNKIGGDLISNAKWRGVRLREVLELAGLKGGSYVVFRCSDGYDVGIPLERAMLDGAMLAYEMNGERLPAEHGFPIRAIIPGLYGMMNAKWVEEIEVVGEEYLGFWQRRGWTNEAEYKTHSTIILPDGSELIKRFPKLSKLRARVGEPVLVAGIAFAGDRGISRVEVSTDGGKTWHEATIKDPLSKYTWVLWYSEWTPKESGRYRLLVRAIDGAGKVQTAEVRQPFPSGATGYHVVDIYVIDSY